MTVYDDDEYEYMEESPYPGPGEYKMPTTVGKFNIVGGGPSAVIAGRYKSELRTSGPAPNAYLPQSTKGSPAYSLGTASRSGGKSDQRSPGPAAYEQKSLVGESAAYSFGGGDRSPGNKADCSPGPVYSVRSTINEKTGWSFSKAGRAELGHKSDEPGPNAYNPNKLDRTIGGAFPKSPRSGPGYGPNNGPSPNDYNPDVKPVTPRAPTTKWGQPKKSQGLSAKDMTPGPGEYVPDIGAVITRSGRAMFGKEQLGGPKFASNQMPGPGAYRPRTSITDQFHKGGKMGRAARTGPSMGDRSPGPVYDLDRSRAASQPQTPKFSFGTASRSGPSTSKNSPGPVYNIPSTVGEAKNTVFGTAERTTNYGKASQSPGPIYSQKSSIGTHGISFSKAGRNGGQPRDCSPGPVYSPDYNPVVKRMPAFAMGIKPTASRKDASPGPGEYKHASTIGNRPITMSGRNERQIKSAFVTPGPPDYPVIDAYRNTVNKAPSSVWSRGRPRPKTSGCPKRRPRPQSSGAVTHR